MFHYGFTGNGFGMALLNPAFLIPFAIWTLVWKGAVLWVTGRRNEPAWFVFFLFVNTLGIGEIIYLALTHGFDEFNRKK